MSDLTLEDIFGARIDRPDHPDFWILSEIILELKASMAEVDGQGGATEYATWRAAYEGIGDFHSIVYCAMQAAIQTGGYGNVTYRQFHSMLKRDPVEHRAFIRAMQTFMDGFKMGAEFVRRKKSP